MFSEIMKHRDLFKNAYMNSSFTGYVTQIIGLEERAGVSVFLFFLSEGYNMQYLICLDDNVEDFMRRISIHQVI